MDAVAGDGAVAVVGEAEEPVVNAAAGRVGRRRAARAVVGRLLEPVALAVVRLGAAMPVFETAVESRLNPSKA